MSTSLAPPSVFQTKSKQAGHPWLAVMSHVDPRFGGLSAAVPKLGLGLANCGFDVSLAAFCAPGEQYAPPGYDAAHLSFWPTSHRRWIESSELRHSFAEQVRAAEGVHVHGLWEASTAMACRTARREHRPYVLSAHGMLEPWALANRRWKKAVYAALLERANVSKAACLHALTPAEAVQYRRFGARNPIAIVPNAVAVPDSLAPGPFQAAFPAVTGRKIVLFLSRLHPKKGLSLLMDAWLRIWKSYPEAVLVLAGPDSEATRALLERRLAAQDASESVLFTGMLDETMKWSAMAAATCFVLPSFSEGLSMSALEAMGAGLPVILTQACNMPEASQAGAGWEIATELEPLVLALRHVLDRDPDENRATGTRGARLIASKYSPARVAEQMAAVYEFARSGVTPAGLNLDLGAAR